MIGYGSIGARHARLLNELHVNTAVVSRREIDFPTSFSSIEGALQGWGPDHIIIASRTGEHHGDLVKLAKHGFDGAVLVEKPLFGGSESMPENNFKRVNVAFNLRFHPAIQALREALSGRKTFAIHAYVGQYLPDWRPGTDYRSSYSAQKALSGGVLRDLCHELDLVQWLAGPCRRMTALGGHVSDLEIDSDDAFSLLLELERCPMASVSMNYLDAILTREIIVHTDQGTLRADLARKTFSGAACGITYSVEADDTYRAQLTAFLENDQTILGSLTDGVSVSKMIVDGETASRNKVWI